MRTAASKSWNRFPLRQNQREPIAAQYGEQVPANRHRRRHRLPALLPHRYLVDRSV